MFKGKRKTQATKYDEMKIEGTLESSDESDSDNPARKI
jgi:hypothetical protein